MHHNLCFNLFILHNNSFGNQGSEINTNDIFLCSNIPWSFAKTFPLVSSLCTHVINKRLNSITN